MNKKTEKLKQAFALIELLTVIAIIALLAAILFPVFSRARENARRSSCQSNLKQIGLAIMQYTQDYDETYMSGMANPGANSGRGWAGQLLPYIKTTQLYTCPSDTTRVTTAGRVALSYVYNYNMARKYATANLGDTQTQASLSAPARTVIMTEIKDAGLLIVDGETSSPTSTLAASYDFDFHTVTGQIPGASDSTNCAPHATRRCRWGAPRHLEGANYLAADGHVKWFPPASISPGLQANTPTTPQTTPSDKTQTRAEGTAVNKRAMTMSPI
jgi:prepilin-type N-terminal cleavage/methylation domain-containing protein/prepilin-type processing-associated H-X9-DG protein